MTDEITIPNAIYLGKENIRLSVYKRNDTPAVRYRYNLNGKEVQIVLESGDKNCTVFIDDHLSMMGIGEVGDYVAGIVNE